MTASSDATLLLAGLVEGADGAAQRLLPLIYDELRALAGHYFRAQRSDQTLEPTALVHEAYLRMIDQTGVRWESRRHFFSVAAMAMRQILTDHARRRGAEKRGGDRQRVALDHADIAAGRAGIDLIALDDALHRLAALSPRRQNIVELRFFGGLTVEEIADQIGVSKTTVENEWRSARAWLSRELSADS